MKTLTLALVAAIPLSAMGAIEGSLDPQSVVEQWSNSSTQPKIIDINFSDTSWPDTWPARPAATAPHLTTAAMSTPSSTCLPTARPT